MKWEEQTYPLDVEYVKRHGCLLVEEQDEKLRESRIRKLEAELGLDVGNMDFVHLSDAFVVELVNAYGGQWIV